MSNRGACVTFCVFLIFTAGETNTYHVCNTIEDSGYLWLIRTAQNTWIRFTSPFLQGSRFPMCTFKPLPPTTTTRRQWQVFPLRRPEKKKHNGCSTTISSSYWLPILVRIDICSHQAQGFAKEVVCQLFSAVVRVMKHPLEDNIRRHQGGQTWSSMQTRTWWLG